MRNKLRDRVLPSELVEKYWNNVQKNMAYFQGLFGGSNFMLVDNNATLNPKQAQKKFNMLVKKGIGKFIKKPIKSRQAKKWIEKQKIVKEFIGITAGDGTIMGAPDPKTVKKQVDKQNKDLKYTDTFSLQYLKEFVNKPKMKKALKTLIDKNVLPKNYAKNISKLQSFLTQNPLVMTQLLKLLGENINESKKEFVIWGIAPGKRHEDILYTKAKSHIEAKKIVQILTKKHGVKNARIQVLDMTQYPKDIWKADKLFKEETSKIKKVVGIYAGRFQPFGPHHKKVYEWMKKQFDDAYITTSDIKKPPKHPMNFKEKVRHMKKMGIPSNKIVKEKIPYVATSVLKKFDKDTTAVVYIFGKKDAGRLAGGTKKSGGKTYYQDYKKNKNNLEGHYKHGYILTAPHFSIQAGGMEVSGTAMRQLLGSPKYADDRERRFKKFFGYFDQGVYNMMTNKFKKLFGEDIAITKELINDFLVEVDVSKYLNEATFQANAPIDDGPAHYYKGFRDYKKGSTAWLDSIFKETGWVVLNHMLTDKAHDPAFDYTLNYRFMPTPSYGTVGIKGKKSERSLHNKYKERINFILSGLGFEVIKWLGLEDGEVRVQEPVLPGADAETPNTDLKELKLFSKEWWNKELLIEAGEEYWTDKSAKGQQDYISKHKTSKNVEPDNPSGKKERSVDPHGNPFMEDEDGEFSKEIHAKHYVVEDENSLVVGTPHTQDDEKAQKFFEDTVMKKVEAFLNKHGAENVTFLPEGGLGVDDDGNPHHYWEGSEQEQIAKRVKDADKRAKIRTWDGEFNNQWNGHEKAPIYKDLAKRMGINPKTKKSYTPSEMSGAIYSNLVGQGDDGKEAMDSYLTEDGKQFLRKNGYTGEFPPKDDSEVQQLYDLNYPEDAGGKAGDGEIGRAQLAWNQARRDNMARIKSEEEKQGRKVLVVPGATHASAIKSQSKRKKQESINEGKLDRIASQLIKDLDKEFPIGKYNPKKVSDFNKLVKHLKSKMSKLSNVNIGHLATDYHNYRQGQTDKERRPAIKGLVKTLKRIGMKESINENLKLILEIDERMTLEEGVKFNNFLKDWAKRGKQPLDKVRKSMMNKNTFSVAKLNDFSVDKVFEMAKKGFKGYQKIINYVPDKIAHKLSQTKFGQKKEKALVKLDDYLKNHPKLKRVMGIGAAAAVTYAWTKMTFIGDPEYDLDLSAAASAAALGEVSFADLFSGEMGTKFLVLTAVGAATGLTAPYVKAFGRVGTMAAGLSFGAYRAYKARKQKKSDDEKKTKTSAPDTVKNPNPKGRKKTISRQSAVQWVAKTKGDKAAKKYVKSLSEKLSIVEDLDLIIEGGAYGHMNHPFDDKDLTFSDLKQIIINGLGGNLDREDGVTEKLDGQNLMISWKDGKLVTARNKGQLKNFGEKAMTTKGVASKFAGRGDIKDAFVFAMKDLSKSIGALSDSQKEKVFGNGKRWMNLEVMWPKSSNVIDYDKAQIVFHGTLEYDDSGNSIGQPKGSARMLAGMIKQVNQHIQKHYKIGKPQFLSVPKSQNFDAKKKTFLSRLSKLQKEYALKDNDTLALYHQKYWEEFIFNAEKQFGVKMPNKSYKSLVKRWAFFDKSYKIPQIRKDFKKFPKFLDWILTTDKVDHQKKVKQNMRPFEVLFFAVGTEILKNIGGYLAASPDAAVQKIRKNVIGAISKVKTAKDVKKLETLKQQISKLNSIGGLDSIVPSEGIVFKYKGKVYKFTGAFAPVNQILGLLTF
jgi:hypothetical protein